MVAGVEHYHVMHLCHEDLRQDSQRHITQGTDIATTYTDCSCMHNHGKIAVIDIAVVIQANTAECVNMTGERKNVRHPISPAKLSRQPSHLAAVEKHVVAPCL